MVIVTTGIARRWFQDGDILPRDTLLVDEIHQTSAELELCLALGQARRLPLHLALGDGGSRVLRALSRQRRRCSRRTAFDPAQGGERERDAPSSRCEFLDETFLAQVIRERRGVGVFLPTRAEVEAAGASSSSSARREITTAFYHGGEPIRVIRPFLEGTVPRAVSSSR